MFGFLLILRNMVDDEITFDMVTTKKGDKGKTSLYDGTRIFKNDPLLHFLGTMDTLTSFLGLAKAKTRSIQPKLFSQQSQFIGFLEAVQTKIIILNGMAASPNEKKPPKYLTEEDIRFLEEFEKAMMQETKIKPEFILQGKSEVSAIYDIARTYCRQAERLIVALIFIQNRDDLRLPQKFLNRLADVIYIMARTLDQDMD